MSKINLNRAINILSWILVLFAIGVLVSPFLTNVTTYFKQKELQEQLEAAKVGKISSLEKAKDPKESTESPKADSAEVRVPSELRLGDPIGIIAIPKIGLKTIFVEGTTKELLKGAPGHIQGTAFPGTLGNSVISGHRTTYGAFFYRLDELVPGDAVEIILADQKITYKVVSQEIVLPNNTEVLKNSDHSMITLTTCYPKYSAKKRLIIKAHLAQES